MRGAEFKSPHDAWAFLKFNGVQADEKELSEIWNRMEQPITVTKPRSHRYYRGNCIEKIERVWEKNNVRYALTNTKRFRISKPDNFMHNYLDRGNYVFGSTVLLFQEMTQDTIAKIKKYWRKLDRMSDLVSFFNDDFVMEEMLDDASVNVITLDQFNRAISEFERRGEGSLKPDTEIVRKSLLKLSKENTDNTVGIGENFLHMDGMKFGLEEKKLWEYLGLHVFSSDQRSRKAELKDCFFRGVLGLEGEHETWIGNFSIMLKVVSDNGKTERFINGVKLSNFNFWEAISEAPRFKTYGEFAEFLGKGFTQESWDRKMESEGLCIRIEEDGGDWNDSGFCLRLRMKRTGKGWGIISPVSGRIFPMSKGFVEKLVLRSEIPDNAFDLFMRLRKFLPENELFTIFEHSREEARRAEERAKQLLAETLENHKEKVKGLEWNNRNRLRHGYVVKGTKRNYFIDKSKLGIYTYPEGRYVCVVDKHDRFTPKTDRLVSRILMLMNDENLKGRIRTLEEADNGDIDEFIEDEITEVFE